jgi:hypothetical protein
MIVKMNMKAMVNVNMNCDLDCTTNLKENAKMKMQLQMGRRCCRVAGLSGSQINAAGWKGGSKMSAGSRAWFA